MTAKNLKPFDLEKMKAGDKVCDEEGNIHKQAVYLDCDLSVHEYPIVVVDSNGIIWTYGLNGISSTRRQLFMVPKMKKLWIAVTKDMNTSQISIGAAQSFLKLENLKTIFNEEYHHIVEIEVEDE